MKKDTKDIAKTERRPTILSLSDGMGQAVDSVLEKLLDDSLSVEQVISLSKNDQFKTIANLIREQMQTGEAQLHNFAWTITDKYLTKSLGKDWKERQGKGGNGNSAAKEFTQQYILQGKCPKCETKTKRSPIILTRDLIEITKRSDYDLATHLEQEYPIYCPNDGKVAPVTASWYEFHPSDELRKKKSFPIEMVKLRVKSAASLAAKSIMMYASNEVVKDIYAMTFVTKNESQIKPLSEILVNAKSGEWTEIEELREDFIKKPKPNGYRALHLTVLRNNVPYSIHLETKDMYQNNMEGKASHISYKEKQITELADKISKRPEVRHVLEELFSAKKKR